MHRQLTAGGSQSLEMAVQAAAEGVDHQRPKVRGPAEGETAIPDASAQLLGSIEQPRHSQSPGLNPALQPCIKATGTTELQLALIGNHPSSQIKALTDQPPLQVDLTHAQTLQRGRVEPHRSGQTIAWASELALTGQAAAQGLPLPRERQRQLQPVKSQPFGGPAHLIQTLAPQRQAPITTRQLQSRWNTHRLQLQRSLRRAGLTRQRQLQAITDLTRQLPLPVFRETQRTQPRAGQIDRQRRPQSGQRTGNGTADRELTGQRHPQQRRQPCQREGLQPDLTLQISCPQGTITPAQRQGG